MSAQPNTGRNDTGGATARVPSGAATQPRQLRGAVLGPLTMTLLLATCVCLAIVIDPRLTARPTVEGMDVLTQFLGEGRKLFANHFFTRSDVYFHSGFYPSIFDQPDAREENHLAEGAGAREAKGAAHGEPGHVHDEHEEERNFLGRPKDPMDAFTRHFMVSKHTHLSERGTNAAREILPWLKLAARLDPNKVETYTVGAFWLRELHRNAESEAFLREGLRNNPRSYELLLELGRCYYERRDTSHARTMWELAFTRWREQENSKPADKQNRFAAGQILNHLAALEARAGNREQAVRWLEIVKKVSPQPAEIDKRIQEVRAGQLLDEP